MSAVRSADHETGTDKASTPAGPGWLMTALIGVLALLIGVGAGWFVFSPEPPDDIDREIQSLIDDYVAAWDAHDGGAVVALMTEDGVHYSGGAARGKEASSDSPAHSLAYFVEHHAGAMSVRSVNDAAIRTQEGPPYLAANIVEVGLGTGNESEQAVEVYRIVPEDGALRIQVHSFMIQGID